MEYSNLPDLGGWAALCAVVEQGGVSAAARRLNIGQPAVTKRLRALEEVYGLPLMERVGGRLQLTPAGEKVYSMASLVLDRQRALQEELQYVRRGQNTIRLEVTFSIGENLLPDLLLRFAELHPQFRVESRLAYSRNIQARLATASTHLALLESAPDHADVVVQKWADDELWLVCSTRHPLASEGELPGEKLSQLRYVLREKGSSPRDALDEAIAQLGLGPLDVALEVGSTDTIIEMLGRGQHVSFLPRFAVRGHVQRGELLHIHVSGFRVLRTLWIARHRNHMNHPVAEAFIETVRSMPMTT